MGLVSINPLQLSFAERLLATERYTLLDELGRLSK